MNNDRNNLFPELSPRTEIFEKVQHLEKNRLDDAAFGYPTNFFNLINSLTFLRLNGTLFEKGPDGSKEIASFGANHLSALYGLNFPVVYVIESCAWEKRVLMGTSTGGIGALKSILTGLAGSTLVEEQANPVSRFTQWPCVTITGIPTQPNMSKRAEKARKISSRSMDSLLTVLNNAHWVYAVVSFPLGRSQVNNWIEQCAMEIQNTTETYLLRDIQKANRMAAHYVKLLERTISRLKKGHSEGIWQNGVYFFSETRVVEGLSLLVPAFSGERSLPEPIRGHICSSNADVVPFENLLNSRELSAFINFPEREYQGFRLKEWVDFDLDFQDSAEDAVSIGNILAYDVTSDQEVNIPLNDLTRHGLVAGATGSGKTNTLFHILIQAWEKYKIPFMVIEPTKAEYRNLSSIIRETLIFTLGEEAPERSSPFRLNPFQFPQGVSLQTHIDYLKAVFNAGFAMYAPMPYILEECLYEVYRDKGWAIVTSRNERGTERGAFPTLTDLYFKIDEVVDRIGYEDRITMDIKSALKTRINNLRVGGKGLMLDAKESISFRDIMDQPTILELKYMGNDDEKTFVMGLILTALYEFYESGNQDVQNDRKLHHITLIEEAHRLLKNVPTEKVSEDSTNMKGKAVETFCNLLAEVRAYGEGILVSEQIPTKLAPDIMKNTNLKVLHRMVSKEERDIMGHTMNLDDRQMRYASTLSQGEAVFFREGLDRPLLIRAPLAAVGTSERTTELSAISQSMLEGFFQRRLPLLYRFPYCNNCRLRLKQDCEKTVNKIKKDGNRDWEKEAVRHFLPLFFGNDNNMEAGGDPDLAYCFEAHIVSAYLEKKGDFHHWSFGDVNRMIEETGRRRNVEERSAILRNLCMEKSSGAEPPLTLCRAVCANVCRYGYEVSVIGKDAVIHNRFVDIMDTEDADHRLINNLEIIISKEISGWLQHRLNGDILRGLFNCYAIQKMDELKIRRDLQENIMGRE